MKEVKQPKKPLIFYYIMVLLVMWLLNTLLFPKLMKRQIENVDYGTFLNMVAEKQVGIVQIEGEYIYFVDKQEEPGYYRTTTFDDPELVERLIQSECTFGRVVQEEMSPILRFILSWILPIVIFIFLGQWLSSKLMSKMGGGIPSMQFGKSNAKIYVESTTGIKFNDVAGEDEAKEVLTEIVDFLHNPQKYQEIGASMPKGALLVGPPGTGKTIVGEHILYTYYNLCRQPGRKKSPMCRCAFALARSRTLFAVLDESGGVSPVYLENLIDPKREERWDLVVVDEAHRIGDINGTMKKLFQKARLVVVLQDDHQRIMMSEEGTLENFRRYAEDSGISFSTFSLASQKRSGYLGSYVSDVDQLLYGRREQTIRQTSVLELRCWDDLNDLDRHLHQLLAVGHHVKWYAPFCWKWSFDTKIKDIHIRQASGNFEKPWNPFPKEMQYNWYVGKKEEYLDQVGCIYTAQGLEFDDIGVIWWDDLRWDENIHDWRVDLSSSCDKQFMAAIRNSRPSEREIVELVLNTYRVMLTRAKGSVHIWFRDWKTREHVRKVMGF